MSDLDSKVEIYKCFASFAYSFEDRAQITSRLYITLNSVIITLLAYRYSDEKFNIPVVVSLGLIVCAMCFCILWYLTLKSITRHTSAKHEVLQDMEKELPLKPYTSEWYEKLNCGKRYIRTTTIHELFPWVFILTYIFFALMELR